MDPDKALVRTVDDGRVNLAVGEPYFLHRHLKGLIIEPRRARSMALYPPYCGVQELLEVLQTIYVPTFGQHVVVTNGAKQAILAALYASRQTAPFGSQPTGVYHRAPHWPTYPTMASLSGLHFVSDVVPDPTHYVTIASSPNNPDGWSFSDAALCNRCDIWDAAYAHHVYGWNGAIPQCRASVWSAAKLLGLSGYRVGWLVTSDKSFADAAADYVEKTTSGVNVHAQLKVAATLRWMQGNPLETARAYKAAREDLLKNGRIFQGYIGSACEKMDGLPANGCGMFAWFRVRDALRFENALGAAGVVAVRGAACGVPAGVGSDWYRMSLGVDPEVLEPALQKLRRYTLFTEI